MGDVPAAVAQTSGASSWNHVTKNLLERYGKRLEDQDYADRTVYLELTTIKQMVNWSIAEGKLPGAARVRMPLKKVPDSPTYCYSRDEMMAIVTLCGLASYAADEST